MDNVLLKKIERCRREMIELSISHELTSEEVVKSSKELDNLLNEYSRKVG